MAPRAALLLFLHLCRRPPRPRACLRPVSIARGCLELGAALAFFMGLRSLPLVTVITLAFAPPLIPIGLGAGGLLVAVTHQTLMIAFCIGDMSFLAPFRYVSIPLSALFGWAVFGDQPGWQLLVGAAVIMVSGGCIFYRERRPARPAAAA